MTPSRKSKSYRFSIRARFYALIILLTLLPFLAYRFVVDLHRILLKDQVTIQQQTVVNLSYILENRTDLWSQQIQSGSPTSHLSHLNLEKSAIWIVNEYGQTTYVVGRLPTQQLQAEGIFANFGKFLAINIARVLPYSLPYPFPQSQQPEMALVRQALTGQTYQQYRLDAQHTPITIMSATPLRIKNHIIGAIILEEGIGSLLSDSLQHFYRLIGIGSVVFILIMLGAIFYTATLSNRIIRLDFDVRKTLDDLGKVHLNEFPDVAIEGYHDEISDLRHHIFVMLNQLSSYERYLKQLPKTLRHEIHNPLNRLSMSLDLLEKEVSHKQIQYSHHALAQLKQIIVSLSEATSIEDSLTNQQKEPFPIGEMLENYLDSIRAFNEKPQFDISMTIPKDVEIMGDGFMIEQMMDKLISNAKDFSLPNHPIQIQCEYQANNVEIRVKNTGPKLPQGYESQIFDGMTSIRQTNTDNQPHLGLGLFIVKLIVDFHHGQVFAQSWEQNEQMGAEFIIKLPTIAYTKKRIGNKLKQTNS